MTKIPKNKETNKEIKNWKKEVKIEMIQKIKLEDKIKEIDKPWMPVEVAKVNDQVVRMGLIDGEYHWHKHTN